MIISKKRNTKKEETMQTTTAQVNYDDLAFDMDDDAIEQLEKKLVNKNTIFKFENGDTVFLLLPAKHSFGVPNRLPFAVTSCHYLGDLEKSLGVSFPEELSKMQACATAHGEKRCAWCEWMNELKASTNRAHKQLGGKLYPSFQAYANIVNVTSRDENRWEVHLARMSKTIVEPLLTQIKYGTKLHDPNALIRIVVKRTETGRKISYLTHVLMAKPTIPCRAEWLDDMKNPMDKIHQPMPYDEARQWIEDLTSGGADYSADYDNM